MVNRVAGIKETVMIVSKFGKSYDTGNGCEQAHAPSAASTPGSSARAADRWADDGGPLPSEAVFVALEKKPGWSVLSLGDLNLAIEREARAGAIARENDVDSAPERKIAH